MTREEATKAAIEAGMTCYGCKSEKLGHSWHSYTDSIERFYAIAYKAGMERAAEICSEVGQKPSSLWGESGCWTHSAQVCAETVCEEAKK